MVKLSEGSAVTTLPTTATRQFAGLVLAPVDPDQLDKLRDLLARIAEQTSATMRGSPPPLSILPFNKLQTVHYARFVLLEPPQVEHATLAFSTDYDGPEGKDSCGEEEAWRHHLADLLNNAKEGLEAVFQCCEGYRGGDLIRYFRKYRRRASTFYVGSSGRSKNQILGEASLRRRVEEILDATPWIDALPERVRETVTTALAADIPIFPAQPDLSAKFRWYVTLAVALAVVVIGTLCSATTLFVHPPWLGALAGLAGVVLCALLAVLRFRQLENSDPQFQPEYSERTQAHFQVASVDENQFLQNQLTHLVRVKPGPLRWLLIRVVFQALQVLATNTYNKGRLGDIPSIHFARWVLIPRRGVLFLSNFDSSWESYLGDFINRASGGLTAVWSNTVDYPRTKWLLKAGSRDASRFLAWTRQHQLPTQVWYCAYPGLSIVNVNDNTEIRRGLADRSIDAATWLFRLRAVDRVQADQLFGEERLREPSLPLEDIQGLVLWGYGHLRDARFLLLRVPEDASDAVRRDVLSWLGGLPLNSAAAVTLNDTPVEPLLNVAFSYRGLSALGVDDRLCSAFSTAFFQNSDHPYRARVNGDVGASAPERWEWGSAESPVHIVLLIYASPETIAGHAATYTRQAKALGLELVQTLEATTLPDRKEHFGFRDGIAQPTVQGSGRAELVDNTIAAGEFLLGHRDGYGNVSHSPVSPNGFNVGLNGSYLVLRQLEQDVEAFWRYCDAQGSGDAVGLASKMVGRWPSGAPLLRHPDADPNDARFSDDDNFTYVANDEDNDRYGARCPFGSHVRRANPRDWQLGETRQESLRLANLHRILRRGRPYGKPLDPALSVPAMIERARTNGHTAPASVNGNGAQAERRGLQFLCFNANIDRQFEFIQQQWCNNPKFAGLPNDPDPLLGLAHPPGEIGLEGAGFTVQTDVNAKLRARCGDLQRFVKVVGSGYFFMPSIPAVQLLGAGLLQTSAALDLEDPPPDEQVHIDSLIANLGEKLKREYVAGKTLRDAHPKMHGCVQALFHVEPNLPPDLAVGLFSEGRTYAAWVRFSNASGKVSDDAERDIRGAAIKLMGVDCPKLLEGEEDCSTHDFMTISHESFVTRNVAEFDALIKALIAGKAAVALFGLTHWRTGLNVLRSLKRHASPLEMQYFSVVPYLLGTRAVKYSLRPSGGKTTQISKPAKSDYLREALKKTLDQQGASFDFLVQIRTDAARMPVEDASVAWSESDAPFRKVATLEIPAQQFDTPERRGFGDNLSFNPWRCLPEHRPLGGINRARRQVYRALSGLRHDRNAVHQVEPEPPPSAHRRLAPTVISVAIAEAPIAARASRRT